MSDNSARLSEHAAARKEAMLGPLLLEVDRRRRVRFARRAGVGAVSMVAVVVGGMLVRSSSVRPAGNVPRELATGAAVQGVAKSGSEQLPVRVRFINDDETVLTRLVVHGADQTAVREMDDAQLLVLMNADGEEWGIARVAGKMRLVTNLPTP